MEPYLEVEFIVNPKEPWSDLLIADMADLDFESFIDSEGGFKSYIKKSSFDIQNLEKLLENYSENCTCSFSHKEIPSENWNKKWEQNFEPVFVGSECVVRAPFHQLDGEFDFEIVLHPKMAFGTGHHQTTYLMIKKILELELVDKKVLDMGSGTGVLAILAHMMKAKEVTAIDIDDWAYENALENFTLNNVSNIKVEKGDVALLERESFNVILANINKNVLLQDLKKYTESLLPEGELLLSGFFKEDIPELDKCAQELGLEQQEFRVQKNWAFLYYHKKQT